MKLWQLCLITLALSGLPVTLPAQSFPSSPYIKFPQPLPSPQISWVNEQGDVRSLADYKGDVILLNFWATWCAPCVIELPHLEKLQRRYQKAGLKVIALSTDSGGAKAVNKFFEQRGISHLDVANNADPALLKSLQVRALPVSFVIDDEGNMIGTVQGYADWRGEHTEHVALALQKRAQKQMIDDMEREVIGLPENTAVAP